MKCEHHFSIFRVTRNFSNLVEKLKAMDIARSRIQLEGLSPPVKTEVTVEDAKKSLKVAQLEIVE